MSVLFFAACAAAALPTEVVTLTTRGAALQAHVADDPGERERGLQAVTELAADEGMVFVYPSSAERYFWMKDTPTPLSIVFCDAAGVVLSHANMAPLTTTLTPSNGAAMYAVEAHEGWFEAHGIRVGDTFAGLPSPAAR